MAIDFERECFFIAPIGKEGSPIRSRSDGVRDLIVKEAANTYDLETRRADDVDEPGQITGQIIQHCLKARMCVADLTGGNPNVYYELSVRDGAQLPVVLIAEVDTDLPFDVSQSRVIFFDHGDFGSGVRAREEVKDQIGVALERLEEGVPADNPISNGMRLAKMHDPAGSDEWQALLFDRLERLSRMTSNIDSRLRRSERGETIRREIRRNRLAHGQALDKPGASALSLYFDENLRRKAEEEGAELRKEAEEAGLSPGAYMDDEIIEAEEPDAPKESQEDD
jgi:hypothetical protein